MDNRRLCAEQAGQQFLINFDLKTTFAQAFGDLFRGGRAVFGSIMGNTPLLGAPLTETIRIRLAFSGESGKISSFFLTSVTLLSAISCTIASRSAQPITYSITETGGTISSIVMRCRPIRAFIARMRVTASRRRSSVITPLR